MEDLPNYLLCASFGFPKKELVQINIRRSGEPEGTAELDEIPLEQFRDILVFFKFKPEDIEVARSVYKLLYREGLNRSQAMERLRAHPRAAHPLVMDMLAFVSQSQRGLA